MTLIFKLFKSVSFAFLLFLAGLTLSGGWAAYFFPPIIKAVEQWLGHTLPYEMNMRFYLAGMILLLLIVYLLYSFYQRNRLHLLVSLLLLAGYLILPVIFIFDTRHSLIEEMSWLRYPSALALLLAGLTFFLISRHFNQGEKWPAKKELVWLVLSAGFVFAGVDEIAEIHEKIGYVLEKFLRLAHVTTDIITVIYFFIGLAVLLWLWPTITKIFTEKSKFFGQLILFALLLFGLAQFFDTFDGIIFNQIRHFTDYLAGRGYFFSDAWYIIYEPKKFLNGLEEIFEYLAGVLFFGAGLILLVSLIKPLGLTASPSSKFVKRKIIVGGLSLILILSLLGPVFFQKRTNRISPLESKEGAKMIASVNNGLFHSDDLDYYPPWGLVLANESEPKRRGQLTGPGIFTFQNGELKRLADPQKLLMDTDSVTADKEAVYTADGAQGKIFRYQNEKQGLVELTSRQNGLRTPEGLSLAGQDLLILDEGEKSVSKLNLTDRKITIDYPRHPLWQSPEGIIYHPILKAFLITDDKTGAIFKYNFGQKIEIWVDKKIGLRAPEDLTIAPNGDVWVSDNGRGEVIVFGQDGTIKKTLRFRPLFRDLQGITLDEQGNLYVVTADAYGSASFMPSYLWKIPQ